MVEPAGKFRLLNCIINLGSLTTFRGKHMRDAINESNKEREDRWRRRGSNHVLWFLLGTAFHELSLLFDYILFYKIKWRKKLNFINHRCRSILHFSREKSLFLRVSRKISSPEMEHMMKEGRSLAETPTYSVASVVTVLVFVCFLVERAIYRFGKVRFLFCVCLLCVCWNAQLKKWVWECIMIFVFLRLPFGLLLHHDSWAENVFSDNGC